MTKVTRTYFYASAFSERKQYTAKQSYTHRTGTAACGLCSGANRYSTVGLVSSSQSLKYIFQLLGSVVLYVMHLYMCIYTQIILHTKKRGAHEFTLGMPTDLKVKMFIVEDEGEAVEGGP